MGGLSIGGYKVEIKTSSNTFAIDTTNCDAETNSSIILATSCSIPVATLREIPFELIDQVSVVARVTAFNDIGDSNLSAEGNGAILPA